MIPHWSEWALGLWSGAGLAWWLIAWSMVSRQTQRHPVPASAAGTRKSLTIFKPLPPLGGRGLRAEAAGIESFVAQLDGTGDLLLGVHAPDRATVGPWLESLRARYPGARLKVVHRSAPDDVANPKIAWQKALAPHAQGELWLWSDADIVAPPGFLDSIRDEFEAAHARLLTFPYIVRERASGPALLDALYVDAEFYPGVLLLRAFGPVDFGLGAGMLFRRDDFLHEVGTQGWQKLGSALADDFVLGQALQPVRLSRTTLVTVADVASWSGAIGHYLRWNRTVWWNRPLGSAARVMVMPVLGWLMAIALHPSGWISWAGLGIIMQVDVFFAALICRRLGYCWGLRDVLATELWSLGRAAVWLACWFPWPVDWRGQRWTGPIRREPLNEVKQ